MSRLALCLIATLVLLASGCGGEEGEPSLGYLPPDAALAVAFSTDFGGEPYEQANRKLETLGAPGRRPGPAAPVRGVLTDQRKNGERASYDEDVKPILGETAVAG